MTVEINEKETVRYIWKCRNKSCKHVWAFDYEPYKGDPKHGYARAFRDGEKRHQYEEGVRHISDDHNYLRCPQCHSQFPKGNRVQGYYSEKHVCGARCLSATGPSCDCSCGGKNHGANHL